MPSKYILLISAVISTIFSAAASILPIWFYDQWTVSALYPTLFTPATYTFSVWSVIYLSWISLWLYEAFWKSWITKENTYLLAAAQILSSLWLIPSQYLWIGSSLIVMCSVFYLLAILYFNSRKENIIFRFTSELFFAWIIVASIANIHLTLVSYNIYFFPLYLTIISIIIWLLINIYFIKKYNSYIPGLVLIWSLTWIIMWQENSIIQITAWLSILAIVLIWFQSYYTQRK